MWLVTLILFIIVIVTIVKSTKTLLWHRMVRPVLHLAIAIHVCCHQTKINYQDQNIIWRVHYLQWETDFL